jgi:hypothetical protein
MSAQPTGVTHAPVPSAAAESRTRRSDITSSSAWREIARHSFAVLSHVNAAGEPRSSGIVYELVGHRLFIAVAPGGWKAREVETGDQVSMTVLVRRGGVLSLLFPIPPATISFHATAIVHPAGSLDVASLPKELAKLVPEARRASAVVFELVPEGAFATYGIGVSLSEMRNPAVAAARVPVEQPA